MLDWQTNVWNPFSSYASTKCFFQQKYGSLQKSDRLLYNISELAFSPLGNAEQQAMELFFKKNLCPSLLRVLGVSPDLFFFQDRLSIIQLVVSVFREIQTLCLSYSKEALHKQCRQRKLVFDVGSCLGQQSTGAAIHPSKGQVFLHSSPANRVKQSSLLPEVDFGFCSYAQGQTCCCFC